MELQNNKPCVQISKSVKLDLNLIFVSSLSMLDMNASAR